MAAETVSAAAAVGVEQHGTKRPYVLVFVILAIITGIEVFVSQLSSITNDMRITLLVVLAVTKGSLVVGYYMHLKYEPRWMMLIPFGALALVFILVAALTASTGTVPALPVP
jgi:cytochrome c oxidase subunit IV